jgi:pimeloyl-ACP methyl ester carboxylesterase
MGNPALVLVHGASGASDGWDPTVEALRRQAPDLRVLAVDLPGRRDNPGDLGTLTIAACARSVVEQIDAAGFDEVVIVGHSMAGITVPAVVTLLGAARVRRMILLAACIPPDGESVLATLSGPLRALVARAARRSASSRPLPGASYFFSNGLTKDQKAFVKAGLVPESTKLSVERVDRSGLPPVPRTWILTLRDRAQTPKAQRHSIAALGGVDELVELDVCHAAMVGAPEELAALLAARCVAAPADPAAARLEPTA